MCIFSIDSRISKRYGTSTYGTVGFPASVPGTDIVQYRSVPYGTAPVPYRCDTRSHILLFFTVRYYRLTIWYRNVFMKHLLVMTRYLYRSLYVATITGSFARAHFVFFLNFFLQYRYHTVPYGTVLLFSDNKNYKLYIDLHIIHTYVHKYPLYY